MSPRPSHLPSNMKIMVPFLWSLPLCLLQVLKLEEGGDEGGEGDSSSESEAGGSADEVKEEGGGSLKR